MSGITVEYINPSDFKPAYVSDAVLSGLRVIPIVSAPYFVYQLALSVKSFVKGIFEKSFQRIADSFLDVIGNAAEITKIVSVVVGNVAFSAVASFFSAIQVVIHGKQLLHSMKFQRDLKKGNSLKKMTDYEIERRLKIDPSLIKGSDVDTIKGELHKRSIQQTLSHALKITAAAVSIVATAVLLAFPPLAPVAFGLWGLAGVLSIGDWIADKIVAKRLKSACLG